MMLINLYNMQIFFLDINPAKAALYHNDKHIVKMPTETAQLLSTVCHNFGLNAPYRPVSQAKELTYWASLSSFNYDWLVMLGYFLNQEYTFRYGKIHGSLDCIRWCDVNRPLAFQFKYQKLTKPPVRYSKNYIPKVEFKSTVKNYRLYYAKDKHKINTWKNRETPFWVDKYFKL